MKLQIKHKYILPFFIMGSIYLLIEVIFRALIGSLVGINNFQYFSFVGWTSLYLFPIGGVSGIIIGQLNEKSAFYNRKIIFQCLIGTIIIVIFEFISGMILNVYFQLNLWNYLDIPFNLYGQICLLFAFAWFFLIPVAIWLDDFLYWLFYDDGEFYNVLDLYKDLFRLK